MNCDRHHHSTRLHLAFTLVELLVVIGIIALLISILLPALSNAREQGKSIKCLSNLRQVAVAFQAYAISNKQWLPSPAANNGFRQEDFIHWEVSGGRKLEESALAPYISRPFSEEVWRCPSDDYFNRTRKPYTVGYQYSYVMNGAASPFPSGTGPPKSNRRPLSSFVNITEKILAYEEDEFTIDDGYGTLGQGTGINMLSIRHDRRRQLPDDTTNAVTLNGDRRGNVAFCDGHAAYTDRSTAHNPKYYDPAVR